jgi:hypothetical protein
MQVDTYIAAKMQVFACIFASLPRIVLGSYSIQNASVTREVSSAGSSPLIPDLWLGVFNDGG